ncbi:MAG: FHA domain-containing protein [Paludisphaera borealis]|uniref:FHA domain-containing protein n=1 Tax=Paludisphaera borealis TaxID=1387353 RepID=UPI00283D1D0D|nr:FHA domain-containing protein [Paludisphaera borealis]MDR3621648.1 FHA domain-containing protein [Paludisphaera borealis]
MKAELVPDNGDRPIPITRDLTVVGRREFADVVIDHASLSKRHCLLVKTDGLLVIRDLITTNGTKVKGQRIRWAALLPDDRIALGDYKMRVYLGPDNVPAPSELYETREKAAAARQGRTTAPPVDEFPDVYAGTRGMAQFPGFAAPSSIDDLVSLPGLPQASRPDDALSPPRSSFTFVDDDDDDLIDLD